MLCVVINYLFAWNEIKYIWRRQFSCVDRRRHKGGGSCRSVPLPLPPPRLPPSGEILIVIKCPLVTIHKSNAWLIERHFLQDNTDICDFFAFPNIKKQANLQLSLNIQKLKVFQLLAPVNPRPGALPLDPATSFLMHTTTEKGRHLAPTKHYCPSVPWPLPPRCPWLQISSAAHGCIQESQKTKRN